ncbi:hypothetical protein ACQPX6_08090 [Actinomycetospora sp. CA-101289]|uniref:hypothetical protein n=1 Tax=Actinomycetospora sp. CA-101289 TaxID=3239893 RepID=UPI003D968D7B
MTASAKGRGGPWAAGRSGPLRDVTTASGHRWHQASGEGGSGEGDHGAEVLEWHPGYQHEVAVVARLRHVACPGGCEETPAVVLRIDNADHAGEIAMTAEDLSSMVNGLLGLRHALLPRDGG